MNIALITARGGSKGLKRKNVLDLVDKPLIAWTIDAALKCGEIDACYVTTEDQEIASISRLYGAKVISRPASLSRDDSVSDDVVAHAINWLQSGGVMLSSVTLLQPTSPLRTSNHIGGAFSLFKEKKADCVISVFEPHHSPAKAYKLDNLGRITGLLSQSSPYTPRQQLPQTFQPNGAIYCFSVNSFNKENRIPRYNVYPYVMSESESVDIDTIEDFHKVELIIKGES